MNVKDRDVLIWLNKINISNKTIKLIMDTHYSLEEFWSISNEEVLKLKGIRNSVKERIVANKRKDILNYCCEESKDFKIITILDEDYPKSLKNIPDRPKVLYIKGQDLKDEIAISIVGSRKSTDYGIWACKKFTRELVDLDISIVSGLALGIDTIAHETTLDRDGYTIAVLGCGIDVIYPKRNLKLYEDISEKGTIITEYPPGTTPLSYNFPQRNRIISGLSDGVIVIEAKEKSGSLITAHHGLEQGRDIFAVPGNINSIFSSGTNKLIKDGARPLLDIGDIMDEIPELNKRINDRMNEESLWDLSDMEKKLVMILKEGPIHSDNLVYKTGIDISTITTMLIGLELKGIIEEVSTNTYMLV